MRTIPLLAAALLLISGCATDPVATNAAMPVPQGRVHKTAWTKAEAGSGSIIVKRDTGLSNGACTFRLFLNGSPFADIDTGEKVQIYVKPGEYIISSVSNGICLAGNAEASLNLNAGQTRTYRVGVGSGGELRLQPTAF